MSLPNTNITVGAAPLLWSEVAEAFNKINENFTSLDIATGGAAVNLETLFTSVSPATDNAYMLGAHTNRWKSAYLGGYLDTPTDATNGVWLGVAQIKGIDGTIELPLGSTVNGSLIIDPDKTFFKSVQIDNGNQVVANSFVDTLNLNSGTAMQLVVDSAAESVTFNNTGVTSVVGGTSISVSAGTGAVTINNTGVTSVTAGGPTVGRAPGTGISVSGATGNVTLTNTGLIGVQAGFGITISNDSASGISQISFNPTAAPQVGFTRVGVPGQTTIGADTTSDILNITAGYGMIITTTESTDTLTFTFDKNTDIKGSVFGDDSSLLVDGVMGRVVCPVFANVTGNLTGNVVGTVTGNIFTSLIDSADSTAITVTPKTIFSSDVDIENELRVRGSMMISVAQLKSIAAASADFTAFKAAIALLTV